MNIFLPDEAATTEFAMQCASAVGDTAIIYLSGALGAGKTTFSRGFLRGLGYAGTVKSPTYTLVEPYTFDHFSVFHFDLYRVNDPHELEFIGIRDYFAPHAVCLIEWPEKGEDWLPEPDISCFFELQSSGRTIKIESHSTHGDQILGRIKENT